MLIARRADQGDSQFTGKLAMNGVTSVLGIVVLSYLTVASGMETVNGLVFREYGPSLC